MAERIVYLTGQQAQAWFDGRLLVLFVPMRPQPTREAPWLIYRAKKPARHDDIRGGWGYSVYSEFITNSEQSMAGFLVGASPFTPGDTLLGKEQWMMEDADQAWDVPHNNHKEIVLYRADDALDVLSSTLWHSPITMPREAVRIHMVVRSVKAVQIRLVSTDDVIAAGIERGDLNDVATRYLFQCKWKDRYGSRYPWNSAWAWKLGVLLG